jgi:enoyl-CoA hydratase/carnithine racemase
VGAVNAVVPRERLTDEIDALIPRVTGAAPAALGAGRRAFYRYAGMAYEEALDASLAEFAAMFSKTTE